MPLERCDLFHFFQTQLQYTISERTGNCSVKRIPASVPDAELEPKHKPALVGRASRPHVKSFSQSHPNRVRVKHARDMLQVDPSRFVYGGQVCLTGTFNNDVV